MEDTQKIFVFILFLGTLCSGHKHILLDCLHDWPTNQKIRLKAILFLLPD
jgi:hypothetical protein